MGSTINIVVTCTNRKKLEASPRLHLRNLRARTLGARAHAWTSRLSEENGPQCSARDLYAGEHWSVVRSLAARAGTRLRPTIWISSAGYGLVRLNALLYPYAATFQSGEADSVVLEDHAPSEARREWWRQLGVWGGPDRDQPRTLQALVAQAPKVPLLVAVSPPYLDAMADDLHLALEGMAKPERLVVLSSGPAAARSLADNIVPWDARMQTALGGTKIALSARLAEHIVSDSNLQEVSVPSVRSLFEDIMNEAEKPKAIDRSQMSDDDVRAFIREELRANPKAKHSPLLRKLRDSGRACEQKRFANLFREVADKSHGE